MSFWNALPKPFFVLAPMADVTDPAYRKLIASIKAPDVTWTEFVSADGIYHTRRKGIMADADNPLLRDLTYSDAERPIVAQLFSSNPESMKYAAELCAELGFDGIDINMGCPDRSIEKQGCGAAMMKSPEKAVAIVEAARNSGLPVTVKTRIGYSSESIDTWLRAMLELELPALTVHLRTRSEMSKVPAHWELMPRIVALRNEVCRDTLIIGNGDVNDLSDAREKATESGCDGIMLGRAIFGNPWLFTGRTQEEIGKDERLDALRTLAHNFDELHPKKSFHILKKHVKAFVAGCPEAAQLRAALMETGTLSEFEQVLNTA